ncbi:MAG: YciI family protein [Ilumatobacteraceae bacterium]
MTRYLVSFDDGTMHIPDGEFDAISEAAHRVLRDAKAAGVYISGGGLLSQQATIVDVDGQVSLGDFPERKAVLGGFVILELPDREAAIHWAARIAVSCRCAQEIREIMHDPEA